MPFMGVSEAARRIGVDPTVITMLFYRRKLSDVAAPIVGGRRMIPASYIPEIERVLRETGHLSDGAPSSQVVEVASA